MKIAIGADHRGSVVLKVISDSLTMQGHTTQLLGVSHDRSCDYPDMAYPVAKAVASGRADRGILICGTGIGMSIAANKVQGVRAALVQDAVGAEISRRHNDANVICIAGDMLGARVIEDIVSAWLRTEFEGGRHERRVQKIKAIEAGIDPTTWKSDRPAAIGE